MAKTLRKQKPDSDVIKLQNLLSANGYFKNRMPSHGIFDDLTHEKVVMFQLQHINKQGIALEPDGVVGSDTWWALNHASGEAQRNHFRGMIPDGLSESRQQMLQLLFEEHAKPVFETPDGSNRSPDIDRYWGDTGLIGYAWCCAFVSWALNEQLGVYPIGGEHHVGVQKMWRSARQSGMAVQTPRPGDIFIQIKSRGRGHTGFVVSVSADGSHIYTVEGNCGNRLKLGKRRITTIDHYIDCFQDGQSLDFEHRDFDVEIVDQSGTR